MKIHIVQKGDTLWSIAKKYGVDFEHLKSINVHISSPDMIMPGMKIKVPTDDKHVKHKTKPHIKDSSKNGPHHKVKQKPKQTVPEESWAGLEQSHLPSPLPLPNISGDTKKQPQTSQKTQQKKSIKQQTHKHNVVNQQKTPPSQMPKQSKMNDYTPYVAPMTYYPMPMCQPMAYPCSSCCAMNYQMMSPYPMINPPPIAYGGQFHPSFSEQQSMYGNMPFQQGHVNYYK